MHVCMDNYYAFSISACIDYITCFVAIANPGAFLCACMHASYLAELNYAKENYAQSATSMLTCPEISENVGILNKCI